MQSGRRITITRGVNLDNTDWEGSRQQETAVGVRSPSSARVWDQSKRLLRTSLSRTAMTLIAASLPPHAITFGRDVLM